MYERAFASAQELYIVNAFLTEWQSTLKLNAGCSDFLLIVGADFGTTRRAALEAALDWVPARFHKPVLAFNQRGVNFHPKAVLWRERDGACYMLLGSSNLTWAAFESNVEANVTLQLGEEEYLAALQWLADIERRSVEVTPTWLNKYVEAPIRGGGVKKRSGASSPGAEPEQAPIFDLSLDVKGADNQKLFAHYLQIRRNQKAEFDARSREPLISLFRSSAAKPGWSSKDDRAFYDHLCALWGDSDATRMGGDQWKITGKGASHKQLARSLVAVLDAREGERDRVVVQERDRLHRARVATRAAVFTELLCHLFPSRYPILDAPVRAWRRHVDFDVGVGGTEGERYLRLSRAMRAALMDERAQSLGVRDLAELDVLIWLNFRKAKE